MNFKFHFHLNKLNQNRVLVFFSMIIVMLIAFSSFLVFKLNQLSKTTTRYENEIFKLIDEKNELAFATPIPGTNFEKGTRIKVSDFTVICPEGAECTYDKDSGYFLIPGVISLNLERLDNKAINNPNFSSPTAWYNALLRRDQKATGEGLPQNYGSTPGYEWGPILPFYRYYELDSIRSISFGIQPGIIIRNSQSWNYEYLFPQNNYVYRIRSQFSNAFDQYKLTELLNTIQFSN